MHVVDLTMFWSGQGGGVQRYLRAKSAHLHRLGHFRHTIVVPGGLTAHPPEIPGIPIPFGAGYRLPRNRGAVQRVLRQLAPDLIEAGDPYQLAWAALRSGQESGVPVAIFHHSDMPELIGRAFGDYARRAAVSYVRRLYRRFDAVFAPSRYVAERLLELGIERVILQPLGVDTRLFDPVRRDHRWRTQHGIARDARVLLYVGRYAAEKNLDVLMGAVDKLGAPYLLVTIGGGPVTPVGPQVLALPYETDPVQLAAAYASADLFVHAGDQETFGLAALEALASGLPVVGSSAGGVGELIDETVGIRVKQCTAGAFAEAIRALDAQGPEELGGLARARAESYDWSSVLARLDAHYARLIDACLARRTAVQRRAA
jgi:alpha-1,6-mannosyltransferase